MNNAPNVVDYGTDTPVSDGDRVWGPLSQSKVPTQKPNTIGVTPSDSSFQALVTNGFSDSVGSVVNSDLEEFLNLTPGVLDSLDNGDVTDVTEASTTIITLTFRANEGDLLTFDWDLLTNEATPEDAFNDFAFFSVIPFPLELADTREPIFFETLADGFNEETGYQTATVAISESGTFDLNFGVVDVGNDGVDSALLIDNVQVVPSGDGGEQVFEDPSGDTFSFGFPQLNIENVSGAVTDGELTLAMDFFTSIAPPSTGLADSVVGFWDLDLDQNPATGIASAQSIFAPPDQQGGPLGVDVFIDLFSEQFQPGFVDLVDADGFFIGSAPITYDTDSLEIEIPLSLLGDDGNLNYGTVIGTFNEPTDTAPNDDFATVGPSLSSSLNTDTLMSDNDRVWGTISKSEVLTQKPTENSVQDRNLVDTSGSIISSTDSSCDRQSEKDVKENQQNESEVSREVSPALSSDDTEYDIDVVFIDDSLTPDQQAVFEDAASQWEEIIIGDVEDVVVSGFGFVDDIAIDASAPFIDGLGGTVGQAGPTVVRSDSFLPARGIMEFDVADLESLEEEGLFEDVILHEMGHVLGFGTIWEALDLLTGAGSDDPRFVGEEATDEYNDIFGVSESGVPVEADFGPDIALGHWDEEVFGNELMTEFINFRENPLSRITAASMGDLGYEVNVDAADAYTPPSSGEPPLESVGRILAMDDLERRFVEPGIVGHDIALNDLERKFV